MTVTLDLSSCEVDAMGLFLLSRRLMQIAEASLPRSKGATSLRLVLADVAYHPGSSISEITARTEFPQSLVSMAVAKLREVGALRTEPDPADRRRTLVFAGPRLEQMAEGPGAASVEPALRQRLETEDPDAAAEALAALEVLVRLLVPETIRTDVRD